MIWKVSAPHSALITASRPSAFSDLGHSTEELMSTNCNTPRLHSHVNYRDIGANDQLEKMLSPMSVKLQENLYF